MGYKIRRIEGEDPIALAAAADEWTSTQHGDWRNEVAIINLYNVEPSLPVAFWKAHRVLLCDR